MRKEEGSSRLEQVVLRGTEALRAEKLRPSLEARDFARFVYSRSGDDLDRTLAESLACPCLPLAGTPEYLLYTATRSGLEKDRVAFLNRIEPSSDPKTDPYRDEPKTALALWRAGKMFGDEALMKRGRTLIEEMAEAQSPDAPVDPALALAAGLMSHHPTQMVLIGDPKDATLSAMREACFSVAEPSKIIINLDPAKDQERIEELGYPADMAPVLFVCVESICSPPIQSAQKIPESVREIVTLSRSIAE